MNPGIVLAIAAIVILLMNKDKQSSSGGTTTLSIAQMRTMLVNWVNTNITNDYNTRGYMVELFQNGMSDSEIAYVYDYIFNYANKGLRPAAGTTLALQIQSISDKYQIFT